MADSPNPSRSDRDTAGDFADQAEQSSPGIIREFVDFLRYNKKWWLIPIIIVLLLIGTFIVLAAGPGGAFIYPFV